MTMQRRTWTDPLPEKAADYHGVAQSISRHKIVPAIHSEFTYEEALKLRESLSGALASVNRVIRTTTKGKARHIGIVIKVKASGRVEIDVHERDGRTKGQRNLRGIKLAVLPKGRPALRLSPGGDATV